MADVLANWQCVQARIRQAAARVGRLPEDIHVVAVTKGVAIERVQPLVYVGIRDVGENRVQEAIAKYE